MTTLWLDTETYSECDLRAHGTHRYAEDESTEITVAQFAIDDDEPVVIDCTELHTERDSTLNYLKMLLEDPDITVVAHNAVFDRTLIRECWGIDVPIERWRCTMVKAMEHGLPGGLEKIGEALGVTEDKQKDKRGRELIQLFCKPRPKNHKLRRATRKTHPAEWAEFLEYSRQDIVAMREISNRLPSWNFKDGHAELALWHLDQRINDRGFAVDLELAEAAIAAVKVEQARLKQEVTDATDGLVTSLGKRDELLAFILAEYGVDLPDMKADTLRRRVDDPDLPDGVRLLLSLRLEATKTSTAKYNALVKATSADGRLRNTLQFAGAQRTARWAGRIFQPQNMPRPTMKNEDIELGIQSLLGGFAEVVFDDVMSLTSNAVRGCIVAAPGCKLNIADLSNIEGRMLAFLAGERWKLKAFAAYDTGDGHDLYIMAYARAFGIDPADVAKWQRQIGKVMELGLGYEGGVAAFLTFAAVYNMDLQELADAVWRTVRGTQQLEDALGMWKWAEKKKRTLGLPMEIYVACEVLKKAWREAHPMTVQLWHAAGDAVRSAIAKPGQTFPIGNHLKARRDGAWLRIRLPSGRYLCYLHPEVDGGGKCKACDGKRVVLAGGFAGDAQPTYRAVCPECRGEGFIGGSGQISYMGVDQYTRRWKRIKTYGGKLIENCTQAAARDVLAHNMQAIDEKYPIVLSVHDELLTETPDTDDYSHDELAAMMSTVPPWAEGIPLAAAGFETYRYRKD